MDTNKPFYDPLITQGRTGNSDSPFVDIQETLYIVNGKALVTEIPDEFHRVRIIESVIPLYEIKKGVPTENEYIVNYNRGYITFGQLFNGERIVVKYKGTGTQKIPDSRVYLTDDDEFELVSDKFRDLDRKDTESETRVTNLIVNQPQPSEVVDMRVDRNGKIYRVAREYLNALQKYIEDSFTALDGEVFTTLKDRLLEIENDIVTSGQTVQDYVDSVKATIDSEFADMKNELTDLIENVTFDITKLHPRYIVGLSGIRNAVNQSVNLDSKTMQIYTTQSDSQAVEGFYINRLSPTGKYISSMLIKEGGHGTMIAVERKTTGNVMIWFFHNTLGKMLRYEYKDNYVLSTSEASNLSDYTPCGLREKYFTPSYDEYYDYMCFRRDDGIVEIRKRADVVNKVDNILYSVTIDTSENTEERPMQGCVSYGSDVYWQSGSGSNVMKIQKYDGTTNTKVLDLDVTNIIGENGIRDFRDSFAEPEGLAYFVNPTTGKHSLLFVVTSGGLLKRFQQMYGFVQNQDNDYWDSLVRTTQQNYAMTKDDGRALSVPDGVTSLNELTVPGLYYMDAETSSSLTDFPYPSGGAGWYLEVSPLTQTFGGMQKLKRNSSGRKILQLERTFDLDRETFENTFGIWTVIGTGSKNQEYLDASDWSNKLSNILLPGEYYITMNQMSEFTDSPNMDAGARLIVYSADNGGYVRQEMIRNSDAVIDTHVRNVSIDNGTPTDWLHFRQTGANTYISIPLSSGATNPDTDSIWRAAHDGKFLIIRGAVNVPTLSSLTKIGTLPANWKPTMIWEEEQLGVVFRFDTDGTINARNTTGASVDVRFNSLVSIY